MIFDNILFAACTVLMPPLMIGVIRKTKARLQNRMGARFEQPFHDLLKLFKKHQTISKTTTWIFQLSSAMNISVMLIAACILPWLSFKPHFAGDDLFLLLYLFALLKYSTLLSAFDCGSPFGAMAASREAHVSLLLEPAIFVILVSLGFIAKSTSLGAIFDFSTSCTVYYLPVWLSAAVGLFLCSLAELSRMPVDDPNTHLELTMIHEAMILENSGKNLALIEYAHAIRLTVLYGLCVQCLLHALTFFTHAQHLVLDPTSLTVLSVAGPFAFAVLTALIESTLVKLQWRRVPEFIAYALTMSMFASASALIGGSYASHHL